VSLSTTSIGWLDPAVCRLHQSSCACSALSPNSPARSIRREIGSVSPSTTLRLRFAASSKPAPACIATRSRHENAVSQAATGPWAASVGRSLTITVTKGPRNTRSRGSKCPVPCRTRHHGTTTAEPRRTHRTRSSISCRGSPSERYQHRRISRLTLTHCEQQTAKYTDECQRGASCSAISLISMRVRRLSDQEASVQTGSRKPWTGAQDYLNAADPPAEPQVGSSIGIGSGSDVRNRIARPGDHCGRR
jgi:hypothetical protein